MANLDDAKIQPALWPPHVVESDSLRLQPILGVAELLADHLFGVSLASQMVDPLTGMHAVMTPAMLQREIERAVEIAEGETGLCITQTLLEEALAFDRPAYDSLGYFRLGRKPIWGIEKLEIRTADQVAIFEIPLQWVTQGQLYRGRINIVPAILGAGITALSPTPASGAMGAAFLAAINQYFWQVPEYFWIRCLVGFPDNLVPQLVNELVGTIAAMNVLSKLAATYAHVQSASVGVDGLSQSVSTPGGQIFAVRMKELADDRKRYVKRLKMTFGAGITLGVI